MRLLTYVGTNANNDKIEVTSLNEKIEKEKQGYKFTEKLTEINNEKIADALN